MTKSGSAAAADLGAQGLMSIGEVLAQLRADFPDITISKLRFLETEGLVEPCRTASGYRKYSWGDLVRLRFILTAQRDQYLPLKVIREQLDAGAHEMTLRLVTADERAGVEQLLTRAELLVRTGLDEEWLRGVEQYGLLAARSDGRYDPEAVEVATVVAQLGEHGLEPRHLRAFRGAADREVGLLEQVVAPMARQRSPEARARAAETLRELAALALRLHAALLQAGLRGSAGG
ncbi:MerR family transcriptional regulator [Longispora fulva]|uniref:DNA-binding transcriptional MerR regulator n=2 Tax=Longispora fulva TaxID=619741 RepID=A0A8J7KES1_9ACTN|nr:DNA-binding transcriptional MerR regulator [Longispora fulva]GIG56461.1 MerR family transcriptional regulator [Longispora fulva]